jgi:hypothetical protein
MLNTINMFSYIIIPSHLELPCWMLDLQIEVHLSQGGDGAPPLQYIGKLRRPNGPSLLYFLNFPVEYWIFKPRFTLNRAGTEPRPYNATDLYSKSHI